MSITVERVPDEPILLLKSTGQMTVDDVRGAYAETTRLLDQMESENHEIVYRIVDVREQTTTFPEMMEIMKVATASGEGTPTDNRIQTIYVGREKFAMLAREMFSRQTGRAFPIFESVEDALEAIRKGF